MKEALILHGTEGSSQGNWFPWLKEKLTELGWKVWVPDLPQADYPNIKRYNAAIFSNTDWKFSADSIIIGHSSGSVAALGVLQNLPSDVTIDTCVLIGSFKDTLGWEKLDGLFEEPFDFEKIKSRCKRFIFLHSDNDPYCPLSHAEYLAEKLNGELIVLPGEGHFNTESSSKYTEFPYLLELLTKNAQAAASLRVG